MGCIRVSMMASCKPGGHQINALANGFRVMNVAEDGLLTGCAIQQLAGKISSMDQAGDRNPNAGVRFFATLGAVAHPSAAVFLAAITFAKSISVVAGFFFGFRRQFPQRPRSISGAASGSPGFRVTSGNRRCSGNRPLWPRALAGKRFAAFIDEVEHGCAGGHRHCCCC